MAFIQLPKAFNGRKMISRGYWGWKIFVLEIQKRWGVGLTLSCGNGKSEGMWGIQLKFPSWWGSGYFLETHIDFSHFVIDTMNRL